MSLGILYKPYIVYAHGKKLNQTKSNFIQYGSGLSCPEEWRNFDVSPVLSLRRLPFIGKSLSRLSGTFPANAEYGDIIKGLPISEDSADAIYSSQVLEHLWQDECAKALANTYRHLKPGGTFRLVVPDVSKLAKGYLGDPDPEAGLRFIGCLHMVTPERPSGIISFLRSQWGRSSHRWMWDYYGLEKFLREAGFSKIREAEFGDSRIEAFSFVEEKSRFDYAVCIECEK